MSLKSNRDGFLVSDAITEDAIDALEGIRADTRKILKALTGRRSAATTGAAIPPRQSARSTNASGMTPRMRDALGRFTRVSEAPALTPPRLGHQNKQAEKSHTDGAMTTIAQEVKAQGKTQEGLARLAAKQSDEIREREARRDRNGRFLAGKKKKGGDGGGDEGGDGKSRIGSVAEAAALGVSHADTLDPLIGAAKEVHDVAATARNIAAPIRRFFSRSKKSKDEAATKAQSSWLKRIWQAVQSRWARGQQPAMPKDGGEGGGALGLLFGRLAGLIPRFLGGIVDLGKLMGRLAVPLAAVATLLEGWLEDKRIDASDMPQADKVLARRANVGKTSGGVAGLMAGAYAGGLAGSVVVPGVGTVVGGLAGGALGWWAGREAGGAAGKALGEREADNIRSMDAARQYAAGNIGGLDDAHTRALVASTSKTESGGRLDVVNAQGYMGRYQAGAAWLAQAGLIRGGDTAVKAAMAKDGHKSEWEWAKSGGMSKFLQAPQTWSDGMSYESYLGSAAVQDKAFRDVSSQAYTELAKRGFIGAKTTQIQAAGLLKARHLAGLEGAIAAAQGARGPVDANGTSAQDYMHDMMQSSGLVAEFSGRPAVRGGSTLTRGQVAALSAAPVAASSLPAVPAPALAPSLPMMGTIPAMPSIKIPAMPEISSPPVRVNSPAPSVVRVQDKTPPPQNVPDRQLAHIVTGGIGGVGR